jgi:hypothetical protein
MKLKEADVEISDLRYISEFMRPADLAEVTALGYESPMSALLASVECEGRVHILKDPKGRPVCIYGLHRTGMGFNAPWMLGTIHINAHKKDFWLHSQRVLREFDEEGVPMWNMVHRENDAALEWLSRLGFEILYDEPVFSDEGAVFYPFNRTAHVRPH